jgi:hypothetical protein
MLSQHGLLLCRRVRLVQALYLNQGAFRQDLGFSGLGTAPQPPRLLLTAAALQGTLGDRLVQTLYLQAFKQQAAYLLDHAAVDEAADVFWSKYAPDERMPASPTRR